jgi:NTP pyrophosphatase (non-canonical NTP hydrolase)
MSDSVGLRDLQDFIKAKDHQPTLKHAYFLKLIEEVGELAEVVRKDRRLASSETIKGTIEEELYDVLYYTVALANVYDVDLAQCFRLKEELNRKKYGRAD